MIITERIFKKLAELSMSQKEFSERTGIPQSTISEWKRKGNPSADKILPICLALDVTPEWLLSGAEPAGKRRSRQDCYIIDKNSELGLLINMYHEMDDSARSRLIGFASALATIPGSK